MPMYEKLWNRRWLRILTGALEPDEGEVFMPAHKRIGLISQIPVYPAGYTTEDVLRSAFLRLDQIREEMNRLEKRMESSADDETLNRYDKLSADYERLGGYASDYELDRIANGLDIGALTSGMDLGSFDIASILGGIGGGSAGDGGNIASGISDKVAGISDMLKSGLQSMGLDPSIADKLLDNEIVNFFANLFIGLGDLVSGNGDIGSVVGGLFGGDDSSSGGGSGSSAPVTPNTGDNGAVFAALGVLTAASCAAFVCLKKKKA